jgi:hypothetical protein
LDFYRIFFRHSMDKASEQHLLQTMERLFAKQSELIREIRADMKAGTEAFRVGLKSYGKGAATGQTETTSSSEEMKGMEAKADARQDKADAKIEARFNQFNEEIKARQAKADAQADAHVERMEAIMRSIPSDIDRIFQQKIEAWKERFLSSEERTTICRVPPVACPDNSEGDLITFEQNSEEMDTTKLEANPEETEAAMERQDLFKEEINIDSIASSEDRCGDQLSAVRRRRGAKKLFQDSVGFRQELSAARKRVIPRAVPAVRKGNIRNCPGRNSVRRVH